jgi:hypothetical protein
MENGKGVFNVWKPHYLEIKENRFYFKSFF